MQEWLTDSFIVAVTALVTGVLTYLGTRTKTAADVLIADRESLRREHERLAQEQGEFRADMQKELLELREEVNKLRDENKALRDENATLRDRVLCLEKEVAKRPSVGP